MKPYEFFRNEEHFQKWLVDELLSYGCHVQPLTGDDKHPGIPDLSVGMPVTEVWAEAKLMRTEHSVWDILGPAINQERKLTAQQRKWLMDRAARGNSLCGVIIGWRTTVGNYVSFIPIQEWDRFLQLDLATLALSPYTETLSRLTCGKASVHSLLNEIALL